MPILIYIGIKFQIWNFTESWTPHELGRTSHFDGPRSMPGLFCMEFTASKVALGQFFSEYFGFPYQFSLYQLLHIQSSLYIVPILTSSLNKQLIHHTNWHIWYCPVLDVFDRAKICVRFEILNNGNYKQYWLLRCDAMQSHKVYRHFGGKNCFLLQSPRISRLYKQTTRRVKTEEYRDECACCLLVFSSRSLTLKMEAVYSSDP
jgi:hypothetical protein